MDCIIDSEHWLQSILILDFNNNVTEEFDFKFCINNESQLSISKSENRLWNMGSNLMFISTFKRVIVSIFWTKLIEQIV